MHLVDDTHRVFVSRALLSYGAVILSFLGGVHWGLAIQSKASLTGVQFAVRLILSVLSSIAGWTALLATTPTALLILATAAAAILWVDLRTTRVGQAPPWYPRLRIPLTCVVVGALLLGASA